MEVIKDNPYQRDGRWYWHDETYYESEAFDTKEEAERQLDAYVRWANGQNC